MNNPQNEGQAILGLKGSFSCQIGKRKKKRREIVIMALKTILMTSCKTWAVNIA